MQLSNVRAKALAGAILFAASAGSAVLPTAASAQQPALTAAQCKTVAMTAVEVIRDLGPEKMSAQFKQSLRDFLGTELKCDGPRDILTPTIADVAAFNTMREILLSPPRIISLQKAGLRSIDPSQAAVTAPAPAPGG
jgi:hypothetical protein